MTGIQMMFAPSVGQVTNLTATNVGTNRAYNNGQINLAWTAPLGTITGYKIERSTDNITYSILVANTANTNVSYSDANLSSGQIYYYRISALNSGAEGSASSAANATATTVPQAPTINNATAGSESATVQFTANATGGSAITSYTVTSSPGSITASGSSSPITVTGLTANTAYTFTITATNVNGTSTASAASNSITALPLKYFIKLGNTLEAFRWTDASGFGTKYSDAVGASSTGTYQGSLNIGLSNYIVWSAAVAPYIDVWPWSDSGFGTRYANAASMPTNFVNGAAFRAGTELFASQYQSPFQHGWAWSSSGYGTKFTSPAQSWNPPSGAVMRSTTDYITSASSSIIAYNVSSSGFGTRYVATTMQSPNAVAVNSNNTVVAVAGSSTPGLKIVPYTGTGFGTPYTDPASTIEFGAGPYDVAFRGSTDIATVLSSYTAGKSNFYVYNISGTSVGTLYSSPANTNSNTVGPGYGVTWSDTGNAVVFGTSQNALHAYTWSNGFGTKYSNPAAGTSYYGYRMKIFSKA